MAFQLRSQGQYMQPGMMAIVPEVANNDPVPIDGYVLMDTVYLQADYPALFAVIGTYFNDTSKGDDNATQFRTPSAAGLPTLSGFQWRIRY